MLQLKTILHPTDFSPQSQQAFHLACSLARDHGGGIVLLHVQEPPPVAEGGMVPLPPPMQTRQQLDEALAAIRPTDPQVKIERRVEEGLAANTILAVAEETRCDLIVLGTHGRTGLSRLLMGSVAEQVVRKAPCPVLTVKT